MVWYTLMNKHSELMEVKMSAGNALEIKGFQNLHLWPACFNIVNPSTQDFTDWWRRRRIPSGRVGAKNIIWRLCDSLDEHRGTIRSLDDLVEKSLALSLSDQYWLRPNRNIGWEDVNYFTNAFSGEIGQLMLRDYWVGGKLNSPDNTTNGIFQKCWVAENSCRKLMKYGASSIWATQPFREVLACRIMEILLRPFNNTSFVKYELHHSRESE
jgi:hypothetical protein